MPRHQVTDDGGDTMAIFTHDGRKFPNFGEVDIAVPNLPAIEIRSDDVIINAYSKSGTNWLYDVLRFLVAGKVDTEDISKMLCMIECVKEERYKDNPSPRILNTHVLYEDLPEQVHTKKPRIIYVVRNPKDTLVSYYNYAKKLPCYQYNGRWENYLKPAVEGKLDYQSWFEYVKNWEAAIKTSDLPILYLSYEDMKEDLFREAKKIRDFLQLDRTDEFVKEVSDNCDFHTMKKTKVEYSNIVFRKGQVGDWKNWFTVAQNEWFDQLYQEKMKDCPLKFRYTITSKRNIKTQSHGQ